MSIEPRMSWHSVDLEDLLVAYRKAKADCFFEKSFYVSEAFAAYEQHLFANLSDLLNRLHSDEIDDILYAEMGTIEVFSKRLNIDSVGEVAHSYFSDPSRHFSHLLSSREITPEFRLVGNFPVILHVIAALWIACVGHKYDAILSQNAYASRVRRHHATDNSNGRIGTYHREAVGSFEPYFIPYKKWRDGGFSSIKTALEDGKSVIAVSLDLSSYYHNIDPTFITNHAYMARVGLNLNDWEISFTNSLVALFQRWSAIAQQQFPTLIDSAGARGVPIGLSAVRIVSNVLLAEFDLTLSRNLSPLYYGRYVDDIFLVVQDPGNINNAEEFWQYMAERVPILLDAHGNISISLPGSYQGESLLIFQSSKQKLFFLSGSSGLDLLQSIAHQIGSLSSERRLLPIPEELETTESARVLAASDSSEDEAVSLRRADGLTVRRLGWALQLRSVEILARTLESHSWVRERQRFYVFARTHILRPDKILEQLDYLPRLLSLAISLNDWRHANELYQEALDSLSTLERQTTGGRWRLNGQQMTICPPEVWDRLRIWMRHSCRDAALRSLPWSRSTGRPDRRGDGRQRFLSRLGLNWTLASELALAIREADLAKRSYKEHVRWDGHQERARVEGEAELLEAFPFGEMLSQFLTSTRSEQEDSGVRRIHSRCEGSTSWSHLPYLVPTRPYSAEEIALYRPQECVFGPEHATARRWAEYIQAVRGIWLRPGTEDHWDDADGDNGDGPPAPTAFAGSAGTPTVTLAVTSLATTDLSWSLGASGSLDLSPERYRRIMRIVNLAISASPKPTHLLLPELSLPEPWLWPVSTALQEVGISLIAGLDYEHYQNNAVSSSAVMVLEDSRLGYRSAIQIRQPKLQPAPGEDESLRVLHGKLWRSWPNTTKPIYVHNGFHFGVLVCSELQNVEHRMRFQGNVDGVFVLSWNRDLETFSSLVESASLDVHAYIALVNNRNFGDSRVRSPAKENYGRDICRIRGGLNEHLVVVAIDPLPLRAQQSRAVRWPRPSDLFKPTPEGYQISPSRRTVPN